MPLCTQYTTAATCNSSVIPGTENSDPTKNAYCQWDPQANTCSAFGASGSTLPYDPTDIDALMNGIEASQKAELEEYKKLRNPTLSEAERSSIRDDINKRVEERTEMFSALITQYTTLTGADATLQSGVQEQIELRKAAEEQLSNLKKTLPDKNKTLKMVQINAYYGKQYAAYANFMKWLVLFAAVYLASYWGEAYMDDPRVMQIVRLAVFVLGGGYLVILAFDLMLRRSDKYDEYKWPFAPINQSQLADANMQKKGIEITGVQLPGVCAGSYCCGEGTTWDAEKGCIITPAKTYLVPN